MKRILGITSIALLLLSLFGCSPKEPAVVQTYEITDSELAEGYFQNHQPVTHGSIL